MPTVVQLKAKLRKLDQPYTGNKATLERRLAEALEAKRVEPIPEAGEAQAEAEAEAEAELRAEVARLRAERVVVPEPEELGQPVQSPLGQQAIVTQTQDDVVDSLNDPTVMLGIFFAVAKVHAEAVAAKENLRLAEERYANTMLACTTMERGVENNPHLTDVHKAMLIEKLKVFDEVVIPATTNLDKLTVEGKKTCCGYLLKASGYVVGRFFNMCLGTARWVMLLPEQFIIFIVKNLPFSNYARMICAVIGIWFVWDIWHYIYVWVYDKLDYIDAIDDNQNWNYACSDYQIPYIENYETRGCSWPGVILGGPARATGATVGALLTFAWGSTKEYLERTWPETVAKVEYAGQVYDTGRQFAENATEIAKEGIRVIETIQTVLKDPKFQAVVNDPLNATQTMLTEAAVAGADRLADRVEAAPGVALYSALDTVKEGMQAITRWGRDDQPAVAGQTGGGVRYQEGGDIELECTDTLTRVASIYWLINFTTYGNDYYRGLFENLLTQYRDNFSNPMTGKVFKKLEEQILEGHELSPPPLIEDRSGGAKTLKKNKKKKKKTLIHKKKKTLKHKKKKTLKHKKKKTLK